MASAGSFRPPPPGYRSAAAFDIARIEEIEPARPSTDVIAFTTAVAEAVGPSARWLHFGLTSSDVIDNAQALKMREAGNVILDDLAALAAAIRDGDRASRNADDRSDDGVHAEPMTFA